MKTHSESRRAKLSATLLAATLAAGALLVSPLGQQNVTAAHALELPSWADVEAAKQNEATAAAKVLEIEGLIADGERELERLRTLHTDAISAFQDADEAYMAAAQKSETLSTQAEQSRAEAAAAAEQAAALVSQMYRSGGIDRNVELFLENEADTADALLNRLAVMSKATERNTSASDAALQAMNTAKSLGEQAEVAEIEREKLKVEKESLEQKAGEAVAGQADAVAAQEAQQQELGVQLEALKDTTTKTVAGYQERLRIEEEQRQAQIAAAAAAAAAEQARLQREAAAAAEAAQNSGGGGAAPAPAPAPPAAGGGNFSGGWLVPARYSYISTGYQAWTGHTGIDLASGCGTPIVAPRAGTVTYVGYKDNIGGNMIHVDHGNGMQTRYAHLQGFNSQWGQNVGQGQVIGFVGTTGMSTGCHLHYEILRNGIFQNPMAGYFG